MIEKNSKGMTASELLREADSSPCSMCHLVMTGDESCATTGCASWAYRLADRIDAELAQARELSLLQGAAIWAKANGWPEFREGEGFGEWLERCFIQRPRYEDGEPVQIGEEVAGSDECGAILREMAFCEDGTAILLDETPETICEVGPGQRVKRPAPEVLGADGLPVVEGETVYLLDGTEGTVKSVDRDNATAYVEYSEYRWSPCVSCSALTHTPPDTQERIDIDVRKSVDEYWCCVGVLCGDCPVKIDGKTPAQRYNAPGCETAKTIDLLRRQRELDARKDGVK